MTRREDDELTWFRLLERLLGAAQRFEHALARNVRSRKLART